MSFNRFKHAFLRLSAEEKVIGLGGLLVLIGSFLPWYAIEFNYDKKQVIENGFSGDMGVVGFVVFIVTLLALFLMIGEYLQLRLPYLGYKKEQLLLFLMGENAFLLLLTIAIYTKRSFDFTNADLRFGLYMALIGATFATFAAFALVQKLKKRAVQEFFDHEEEEMTEPPKSKKGSRPEPEEPEPSLLDEETLINETPPQKIPQEEALEEEVTEDTEDPEKAPQENFFRREAGLNRETKGEEEEAKEKKDNDGQKISMNFYED